MSHIGIWIFRMSANITLYLASEGKFLSHFLVILTFTFLVKQCISIINVRLQTSLTHIHSHQRDIKFRTRLMRQLLIWVTFQQWHSDISTQWLDYGLPIIRQTDLVLSWVRICDNAEAWVGLPTWAPQKVSLKKWNGLEWTNGIWLLFPWSERFSCGHIKFILVSNDIL